MAVGRGTYLFFRGNIAVDRPQLDLGRFAHFEQSLDFFIVVFHKLGNEPNTRWRIGGEVGK